MKESIKDKAVRNFIPSTVIVLLAMGAFIIYLLLFWQPDVLTNWRLSIPAKDYTTNETVKITSSFEKVRDVTGTAKRYIVCKTPSSSTNRIPISESFADRPKATSVNDIYLQVPTDIPSLPAECYVEITIDYNIYQFKTVTEHNRTPSFKVNQRPSTQSLNTSPQTSDGTTDSENTFVENSPKVQTDNLSSQTSDPTNSTSTPQQLNVQQVQNESSPVQSRPSLGDRICSLPLIKPLICQ